MSPLSAKGGLTERDEACVKDQRKKGTGSCRHRHGEGGEKGGGGVPLRIAKRRT